MKKLCLFLLLFGCLTNLKAQYFPFPMEQKSYFQYENIVVSPSDTTINQYYTDSLVNFGTYQIFHFNYTTPDYNGCYENVNNSNFINYSGSYTDQTRPDSIIQKNDTLLLSFSNGISYSFTDSITFLPLIEKDSSWFSPYKGITGIDALKFTCDSIYLDTILRNLIDSVKIISIQSYANAIGVPSDLNGLKLFISKNYGFTQWVSFYGTIKEVALIGIDSGTVQKGFKLPQFSDYFHLNIGDEIIWKEFFDSYDLNYPSYTKYFKDSITSVSIYPDSVIYGIIRFFDIGGQLNTSRFHNKEDLKGLNLSTTIWIDGNSMKGVNSYFFPHDLIKSSGIYYSEDTVVNRDFEFNGYYYDSLTCAVNVITDSWTGTSYNTYYGLKSYYLGNSGGVTNWSIEGSIVSGIQKGKSWGLILGVNSLNQNNIDFKIYPNPNNGNNITITGDELEQVNFYNIHGQLIKTIVVKNDNTVVKLNNQPKGIYFVKAHFKNGTVSAKKLIIK